MEEAKRPIKGKADAKPAAASSMPEESGKAPIRPTGSVAKAAQEPGLKLSTHAPVASGPARSAKLAEEVSESKAQAAKNEAGKKTDSTAKIDSGRKHADSKPVLAAKGISASQVAEEANRLMAATKLSQTEKSVSASKPAAETEKSLSAGKPAAETEKNVAASKPVAETEKNAAASKPAAKKLVSAKKQAPAKAADTPASEPTAQTSKAPLKKSRFLKGESKPAGEPRAKVPKASKPNPNKDQAKPKGRVYRSIHEKSWMSLLVGTVVVVLAVVCVWWYRKQAPQRAVDTLKNFEIPSEHVMYADVSHAQSLEQGIVAASLRHELKKNKVNLAEALSFYVQEQGKKWQIYDVANDRFVFIVKEKPQPKQPERLSIATFEIDSFRLRGSPSVATVVDSKSVRTIEIIRQRYAKMSRLEKIAAVIALGEMRDVQGMPIVIEALLGDEALLAGFASRALAKFAEAAVQPVMARIETTNAMQKSHLLDGIGRSKHQAALTALLSLSKASDATTRQIAVSKLAYFGEHKTAIDALFDVLTDSSKQVGDEAVRTLYRISRDGHFQKHGEHIIARVKQMLATNPERPVLARLYRVMGMLVVLNNVNIPNYPDTIKNFKELMRKSLHSEAAEEIAAAAYGLGLLEDNEASERLILLLEHKSPEVCEDVGLALNNINDADIVQKIIASHLASSNNQYTLLALAKICNHYHLHIVKLGLKDKAIQFLQEAHKHSKENVAAALAETLSAFGYQGEKR